MTWDSRCESAAQASSSCSSTWNMCFKLPQKWSRVGKDKRLLISLGIFANNRLLWEICCQLQFDKKKVELTIFFLISKLLNLNFHCQKLLRCKCTFPIFFCLCKIFGDLRRHLSLISNEKMSNLTSKATLLKYRLLCPPWLLCDKIAVNFEHWEASFHPFHLFFSNFSKLSLFQFLPDVN